MKNENIKSEMYVLEHKIGVMIINGMEYISLTDLARYKNKDTPGDVIIKWMSNKSSYDFYCLWEELNNNNFKLAKSREFKIESGSHSFVMSPTKWINLVNAVGFICKRGKYDGGTYAHSDIALEFASWLSPEFKLYVIQEFQRLKKSEAYNNKIEWHANRLLSKANYLVHTDAVKNYIVPTVTDKQIKFVYASEGDVLNDALFGMTAKEWRDLNPKFDGNIRDNTDLLHLIILSNLENINAELIKMNISQGERLVRLNSVAKNQINILKNNKSFIELNDINK